MGEDSDRPDRVKVVLDFVKPPGFPDGILQIFELTEGVLPSSRYARASARAAMRVNAVAAFVYLLGRRVLFVPPNQPLIRAALEQAEDRDSFEFGSLDEIRA